MRESMAESHLDGIAQHEGILETVQWMWDQREMAYVMAGYRFRALDVTERLAKVWQVRKLTNGSVKRIEYRRSVFHRTLIGRL